MLSAVRGQPGERAAVALEASRQALAQESEAPKPLRELGAGAEEQRRVLAPEPAQDLRHDRRLCPRLRVDGGDLPAVRERRLEARRLAPLDHRDLVAGLGEVPGRGGADDAGPEDQDVHSIMIAACLFSPSASAASSSSAITITSRTMPRWSAMSCC